MAIYEIGFEITATYCVNVCMNVTNCVCAEMAAGMNVCMCDAFHCVYICVFLFMQYVCVCV